MNEQVPIAAIVLAAGKSERMDGNHKLLLPFAEKPLIAHVIEKLISLPFQEIVVVVGYQQEIVRQAIDSYPVKIVTNLNYEQGMATSIIIGLQNITLPVNGYLFLPGDMPLISREILQRLIRTFSSVKGKKIVYPEVDGTQKNPVIFPAQFREALFNLKGDQGGKRLIRQFSRQAVAIPFQDSLPFRDIDTMEDYQALLKTIPQ